ncbi:hypothetical protein, partial [Paraburkholderia sp. C35]|uniref:hypothetical protein n=1 Tax=Paraburkholderia sp. C35 TaxID=2126993 RepID=UPI00194F10B6
AYFSLPRQRKVGAAPHRGNTSRPLTTRGRHHHKRPPTTTTNKKKATPKRAAFGKKQKTKKQKNLNLNHPAKTNPEQHLYPPT